MSRTVLALVLSATFSLSAIQPVVAMNPKHGAEQVHMPSHGELQDLKRQAMAGSGDAALSVALWHMKFPNQDDTDEKWARIAAENGSSVGQFNLGMMYLEKDLLARTGARFWLEQAAEGGHSRASEEFMRLNVVQPSAAIDHAVRDLPPPPSEPDVVIDAPISLCD